MGKVQKFSLPKIEELSSESKYLYDVFNAEENDLACVLIATSYLESGLGSMLERYFIDDHNITSQLFNPLGGGALSTFSARSDIAFALGVITEGFHKNLKTIGRIRNTFAHSHSALDLNAPAIAKLVVSLTAPTVLRTILNDDGSVEKVKSMPPFIELSPRNKLSLIVIFMFNRLILIGLAMNHRPKETQGWA